MRFCKKRNRFEASNVTFNPETMEAFSYDWWQFVKVINGKIVFNNYSYSRSTCRHQSKVKWELAYLNKTIDYIIRCPSGLQSSRWLESSVEEVSKDIKEVKCILNSTRRKKSLDGERLKRLQSLEQELKDLYSIDNTLYNIMESE